MMDINIQAPQTAEEKELRATAKDWQWQYHTLKEAIECLGYVVLYDEHGAPTVKSRPGNNNTSADYEDLKGTK
jgi:hypothetical protein